AIADTTPDHTIHLGDIYYAGDAESVESEFPGRASRPDLRAIPWPPGSRGSFALNGNHEMYAKGERLLVVVRGRLPDPRAADPPAGHPLALSEPLSALNSADVSPLTRQTSRASDVSRSEPAPVCRIRQSSPRCRKPVLRTSEART
ncbi:MAG: hypothetical protein ACREL5_12675, partial [Gemmatimonadales bacterium]